DRDTAEWSAESLGRAEMEEIAEGVSYGANTIRDGVSLTPKRELRALALPAEIMRLANLEGYLKLPGPWPVAEIRLKYTRRARVAERFVARVADTDKGRDERPTVGGDESEASPVEEAQEWPVHDDPSPETAPPPASVPDPAPAQTPPDSASPPPLIPL
ncbi:MAG: type IV secretion system DNA-binding domain-containing protein, partial [Thiotrichales bacterium]|nr:type IV secretion system DNA-binding domain-containing protein [Thiotrichales bacterium]